MDANLNAFDSQSAANLSSLLQEIAELKSKMVEQDRLASLGYLTAGIIHEIKNPLNFIINFSKIGVKMTLELKEVLEPMMENLSDDDKDNLTDICSDLNNNLVKITESGERALRIMTNMLAQ